MGYWSPVAKYDAILPAGGRVDAALAEKAGTDIKALVRFGEHTILGHTLKALEDSGLVDRTVVIGPSEILEHPDAASASMRLAEGDTGPENIYRGLDALVKSDRPPEKVMVVTTDLPFLTPELLKAYVKMCPKDVAVCVPLISKSSYQSRFPNSTATFVELRDDTWTAGCAYLMDVKALQTSRPYIERVFENRKSKMGMARLLGPAFVLKWLTKRLTLQDLELKIKAMLHCSGAAVTGAPPELAYDIDDLEDYDYAMQHLLADAQR
jgi:GTP:adenosylcobinamide-phosphate guanylyltransferase